MNTGQKFFFFMQIIKSNIVFCCILRIYSSKLICRFVLAMYTCPQVYLTPLNQIFRRQLIQESNKMSTIKLQFEKQRGFCDAKKKQHFSVCMYEKNLPRQDFKNSNSNANINYFASFYSPVITDLRSFEKLVLTKFKEILSAS